MLNLLPSNVIAPRPGRLQGRRVLVVEGRRDAALAAAATEATMSLLFAREGARIAIAGPDGQVAMEIVDRIQSDGGDACAIAADLAFEADIGWIVREACRAFGGGLDGLVLNAAGGGNLEHQFDAREWSRVFDLNLGGLMLCCREALAHFSEGGSIVFTTALNPAGTGRMVCDPVGAAIAALMQNIADEVASRTIRANLVFCDPRCAPPSLGRDGDARFDQVRRALAGRTAAAAMANAALFFLSYESAGISAQTLSVMCGHDG
ncbi:SDR family NAD(P)-dependent oxidoreductase [Bradyrhizobium sp. WSM3983]|uniref:SDR family NAD(P)-dependent oxidoreductase n=1 Tax=Bradyrhizobium sp. WSM3983 TaxID=1038867 RepID=UPI0007C4ED3C|nr:SDR family oxidoreductase [Bradyrhizobium sp. WSM3983]